MSHPPTRPPKYVDDDNGDLNGDGKDDCEQQDVDSSDANTRIIIKFLSCILCISPLHILAFFNASNWTACG